MILLVYTLVLDRKSQLNKMFRHIDMNIVIKVGFTMENAESDCVVTSVSVVNEEVIPELLEVAHADGNL